MKTITLGYTSSRIYSKLCAFKIALGDFVADFYLVYPALMTFLQSLHKYLYQFYYVKRQILVVTAGSSYIAYLTANSGEKLWHY